MNKSQQLHYYEGGTIMLWQFIMVFVLGAILGGGIVGIVAYKKGRKDEYKNWKYFRMLKP